MNFVTIVFFGLSLMMIGIQDTRPKCMKFLRRSSFSKSKPPSITKNWPEEKAGMIKKICLQFVYRVLEGTNTGDSINGPQGLVTMINELATPKTNLPANVPAYEGVFSRRIFLENLKIGMNDSINLLEKCRIEPSPQDVESTMLQISGFLKQQGFATEPPEYIADALFRYYRKMSPKTLTYNNFLEFYGNAIPIEYDDNNEMTFQP